MGRKQWLWLAVGCAVAFVVLTVPILWGQNWPGDWALVELALGARSPFWTAILQGVTFFGSSAAGLKATPIRKPGGSPIRLPAQSKPSANLEMARTSSKIST